MSINKWKQAVDREMENLSYIVGDVHNKVKAVWNAEVLQCFDTPVNHIVAWIVVVEFAHHLSCSMYP